MAASMAAPAMYAQEQPAQPTADEIVGRMTRKNDERAAHLKGYKGRRIYELHYRGFPGNKDAEMVVTAWYEAPATKRFDIVSQSGSKYVINKVFKRLLSSEQEALAEKNRTKTALTPENYTFELLGSETTPQGRYYVLEVSPKVENTFLYRGKVWVDANDFAVARIEAAPAKNPSFWIRKTQIEHVYGKHGEFWLPQQNVSISKVRLGGTATLTIRYEDYVLADHAQLSGNDHSGR